MDREETLSFELFMQKSANMLHIWEKVVFNLTATDVARCLRVCKGLRHVTAQCLASKANQRWRKRINFEVMARAASRGETQQVFEVSIERKWRDGQSDIFALDDTWFWMESDNSSHVEVVKVNPTHDRVSFRTDLPIGEHPNLHFNPTLEVDRAVADIDWKYPLVHIRPRSEVFFQMLPQEIGPQSETEWMEICNEELSEGRPTCARYRLYSKEENSEDDYYSYVAITLLNKEGRKERSLLLHKFINLTNDEVVHSASNDEVINYIIINLYAQQIRNTFISRTLI